MKNTEVNREQFVPSSVIEETTESVDELRQRLDRMKKLMSDRNPNLDGRSQRRNTGPGIIDGNFLSVMFGIALAVIVSVSAYAFYNLFIAILRRNARYHEEL